MFKSIILACLLSSVSLCHGEVARLTFSFIDGGITIPPPHTLLKSQEGNIPANEAALVTFLESNPTFAKKACGVGIWRFYPMANWDSVIPVVKIYQIGSNEKEQCFNLGLEGPQIAKMMSYRALGYLDANNVVDLNRQSITFYEGEYFMKQSKSYRRVDPFPITNIPTLFNFVPKSFVITGQTDTATPPDNTKAPVFRLFWSLIADDVADSTVCFFLIKPRPDLSLSKMFIREKMGFVDVGGTPRAIVANALHYLSYADYLAAPAPKPVCTHTENVGMDAVTNFKTM